MRIHQPKTYGVITASGVTFGWRCAVCNIPSMRFKLQENRDRTLQEHLAEFQKKI